MPANMVLIEKITVGAAGASSVTFSGIPQTGYTDLVVKLSARTDRASQRDNLAITFNGGAKNTNWSGKGIFTVDGSTVASESTASELGFVNGANATSSTFSNVEFYVPNYASSSNKSLSIDSAAENNATAAVLSMYAGLYSSAAATTSITLAGGSGNFVQGSTFYLYGVAKLGTTPAISPYATGGDIIDTDGTYWYHTFLSSGTFTPQKPITCDYLVVAGGGGGGSGNATPGGGGGAGGLRSTVTATGGGGSLESALSLLSNTNYTVTIGAGGAGGSASADNRGVAGSNSVFATVTSTGGGFGAENQVTGGTGGSGGGGSFSTGAGGTRTASPVQGNNGGAGAAGSNQPSGGGGGAGAVGGTGTGSTGGAGGAGVAVAISGSSVTYAGGGGGSVYNGGTAGAGGAGGGGAGAYNSAGSPNGTANLGGGGGGTGGNGGTRYAAGNGGSGIVIVRYAV